jgi:hypothetical protein
MLHLFFWPSVTKYIKTNFHITGNIKDCVKVTKMLIKFSSHCYLKMDGLLFEAI